MEYIDILHTTKSFLEATGGGAELLETFPKKFEDDFFSLFLVPFQTRGNVHSITMIDHKSDLLEDIYWRYGE